MTVRRAGLVALGIALAAGPAAAGALPHCDPAPTPASEVARAKRVVIATAKARTRKVARGLLRTELAVVRVLRGDLAAKAITVDDCDDWKCAILDVPRGETIVIFLVPGERAGHWEPQGPRCANGFNGTWLPYDDKDPKVAAILAAAAP